MTPSEFKLKIANAKDLDFGTIINKSIELFKKSWLHGFVLQLFVVILMIPFFIVLYVPLIMIIVSAGSGQFDSSGAGLFAGLSVLYGLFLMVAVLVIGVVQIALSAAFFKMLRQLDEGQEVKTSDLFYFLKGKFLGKIVLLMLITFVIAVPAALLFYLPFLYIIVPMSFFTIVFAMNPEWSVGDIVGSSFRLGNKKWLLTFGLLIVTYIGIMMLSFISCGLGSLFLTPFLYHPLYYIYKDTIGFDHHSELDQIGEQVVF